VRCKYFVVYYLNRVGKSAEFVKYQGVGFEELSQKTRRDIKALTSSLSYFSSEPRHVELKKGAVEQFDLDADSIKYACYRIEDR
jgi:hypothetical protein